MNDYMTYLDNLYAQDELDAWQQVCCAYGINIACLILLMALLHDPYDCEGMPF